MSDILDELARVLDARKNADPAKSYTASLYAGGLEAMAAKITEEAAELAAAGRMREPAAVLHEAADLWFHSLVLLCHLGLSPADVLAELERRAGRSGLDEKAGRDK